MEKALVGSFSTSRRFLDSSKLYPHVQVQPPPARHVHLLRGGRGGAAGAGQSAARRAGGGPRGAAQVDGPRHQHQQHRPLRGLLQTGDTAQQHNFNNVISYKVALSIIL